MAASLAAPDTDDSKGTTTDVSGRTPLLEAPASVQRGERDGISRMLGFAATLALLITGTATFLILIGLAPIAPTDSVVGTALAINSILVAIVVILIGREVWIILQARRKGRAAARLHVRIVGLFALVAAIPAILVAIVASITLDVGLDRWFEIRTKQIVASSVNVARAYMDESRRTLTGNTISMAADLDRSRQIYSLDRQGFKNLMTLHAKGRGFLEAELLHRNGSLILSADIKTDVKLPKAIDEYFQAADTGDPVAIPPGNTNFIGAMFKLREIPDAYLYTIMSLRPEVVQALRQMEANTAEYAGMERNRFRVQLAFAVLYIGVCLIVLLAAIWMGISVADRFVAPIRRLITAADAVSSGDLDVHVGTKHTEGDLKNLSDTFNVMISELKHQRDEILTANADIAQRARFTEAVLSGVSAAVLGVDGEGKVTIANRAALPLFDDEGPEGASLQSLAPELAAVFKRARAADRPEYREQITTWRAGRESTLNVQVTVEQEDTQAQGDIVEAADGQGDEIAMEAREAPGHSFVITIDDITDLVAAQRNTAWSDVARRIAHEIKNPLTPIQLSAERIRRRYGKYITEDREVFDQCTDTIVRQVGDIGRMVDEFSSFARMPKPVIEPRNLTDTLSEAVFLQKVGLPQIEFVTDFGKEPLNAFFDARLMSQAFINVIKNAAEAIDSPENTKKEKGRIDIRARRKGARCVIEVIDNGKGLPKENRQRLLEPYMTTREKGTGLGLAIVRKIMEDHGGSIELLDAPSAAQKGQRGGGQGAMVRLILPAGERSTKQPEAKGRDKLNSGETSGDTGAKKQEDENNPPVETAAKDEPVEPVGSA
ncbi:MAG: PAS domain-containing sensor histidine kinase [Salaquimonas sp.]|nr:PAS domain-containing sensor histidine kinase [Salaquimonas sp.]